MDTQPSSVGSGAPIELRGRYSSFRAAGVAKSRAEGVPITLDRARRSAGGSGIPAALLGTLAMVAFIGWPFALTAAIYAHEADSYEWSAPRISFGLMAVGSWLAVVIAIRWTWRRTSVAHQREEDGRRDRALTRLGEAAADAAGAFDWDEILLRDSPVGGPMGIVLRSAALHELPMTEHVQAAWSELAAAIGEPVTTVVHVLNSGEIWGSATPNNTAQGPDGI